jgi:predicted anti-sigma-YlaC factor YlaD
MAARDPRELSHAELDALLQQLQKHAFEIYEDAALRAETHPAQATAAYARAEAAAAPLIAQAKAVNDERVRRLCLRAHIWRRTALAIAIIGSAALAWFWLGRG